MCSEGKMLQIIMISLNNQEEVKKTLESIVQLTIPFQVTIVDSSNDSKVKNYSTQIPELKVRYVYEKKSGIYHAMNTGWKRCKNKDLIWFLNPGDVLISEESLKKLLHGIETSGAFWGFAQAVPALNRDKIFPHHSADLTVRGLHLGDLSISHQAMLVYKHELHRIGGFNETYQIAADLDLEFKLLHDSIFYFERSALVAIDPNGFSHKNVFRTIYESALVRYRNKILSRHKTVEWFFLKVITKVLIYIKKRIKFYEN